MRTNTGKAVAIGLLQGLAIVGPVFVLAVVFQDEIAAFVQRWV